MYILECIKFAIHNDLINPADMLPKHHYSSRHNAIDSDIITLSISENEIKFSATECKKVVGNLGEKLLDGEKEALEKLVRK